MILASARVTETCRDAKPSALLGYVCLKSLQVLVQAPYPLVNIVIDLLRQAYLLL